MGMQIPWYYSQMYRKCIKTFRQSMYRKGINKCTEMVFKDRCTEKEFMKLITWRKKKRRLIKVYS